MNLLGKSLHPLVQAGIVVASALIVLIGGLFRLDIESESWSFALNSIAAWGSLGLMVGAGGTALYAQTLSGKRPPLKSESNTVALLALMILGFFAILVSYRGYWIASANHRMSIDARQGEVWIEGAIGPSLPEKLEHVLGSRSGHRLVLKDNTGGDVIAAVMASMALRDAGIAQVRIEGDCASSCAFLAMLMPERYYGPQARLGFHDVRSIAGNRQIASPEREILRVALRQAGLSAPVVSRMLASNHIEWFTRAQLVELGVESE